MRTINFAIVGYGGIGKTHAIGAYIANIKYQLPFNIQLTHIVTRRAIDNIPLGVVNTTNIEDIFKNPTIDFVDICTPNDSHMEIAKKATQHGKAVYCEKPLASSYNQSLQMLQEVKKYGVVNGVAFNYRFIPGVYLLKKAIKKEVIGDIIDFKATLYHDSYLNPNKKGTWRTKADHGGGALLDLGIHLIDIIHYAIGDIKDIKSDLQIFFTDRTEVDEIAKCNIVLNNGAKGKLEVSRIHALQNQPTIIEVYGTKGSIKISSADPYHLSLYKYKKNKTYIYGLDPKDNIPFYYPAPRESLGFFQDTHTAALIDFCNQIVGNPYVGGTFEDGLRAQKVVDLAY